MSDLLDAQRAFRDELLAAGHMVPLGRPGVWGRSAELERVLLAFAARLGTMYTERPQTEWHFGPVVPTELLETTGYVNSQPQMVGSIDAFYGDDEDHRRLVADREEGRDWRERLSPAGLTMVSAACQPLYGALQGQQVSGSFLIHGTVFRHEPSDDPFRTATFRQKESVRVGTHDECVDHREHWITRALELLGDLGLDVSLEVANDPFFGRAGRLMARGQRAAALKQELTTEAYPGLGRMALASGNLHGDHFTKAFSITTADGSPAETACMGFGLERVTLCLFKTHGMDVAAWPTAVTEQLGL